MAPLRVTFSDLEGHLCCLKPSCSSTKVVRVYDGALRNNKRLCFIAIVAIVSFEQINKSIKDLIRSTCLAIVDFASATKTISDFLNVGRQRSKLSAHCSAAMRRFLVTCVTWCVDSVVLPIVRWSDREHLFVRKYQNLCMNNKVKGHQKCNAKILQMQCKNFENRLRFDKGIQIV